jgi:hypothetical protein
MVLIIDLDAVGALVDLRQEAARPGDVLIRAAEVVGGLEAAATALAHVILELLLVVLDRVVVAVRLLASGDDLVVLGEVVGSDLTAVDDVVGNPTDPGSTERWQAADLPTCTDPVG